MTQFPVSRRPNVAMRRYHVNLVIRGQREEQQTKQNWGLFWIEARSFIRGSVTVNMSVTCARPVYPPAVITYVNKEMAKLSTSHNATSTEMGSIPKSMELKSSFQRGGLRDTIVCVFLFVSKLLRCTSVC